MRVWHTCPSKSIPAEEIEQFVLEPIRGIGRDPNLIVETVDQTSQIVTAELKALDTERRALEREVRSWQKSPTRQADLQERILSAERRLAEIVAQTTALERTVVDQCDVAKALRTFELPLSHCGHR